MFWGKFFNRLVVRLKDTNEPLQYFVCFCGNFTVLTEGRDRRSQWASSLTFKSKDTSQAQLPLPVLLGIDWGHGLLLGHTRSKYLSKVTKAETCGHLFSCCELKHS